MSTTPIALRLCVVAAAASSLLALTACQTIEPARGGRKAWKAFHDEFFSYGGPRVPLARSQLLVGAPGDGVLIQEVGNEASDDKV